MAIELDDVLAAKINDIAAPSRRSIRESARAAQRRSYLLASASLAALVGSAATSMALAAKPGDAAFTTSEDPTTTTQIRRVTSDTVSRSQNRAPLGEIANPAGSNAAGEHEGSWQLNDSDSAIDVNAMTRVTAANPVVASLLDGDRAALPAGFDPNHATGDTGNSYSFSQCTWWVYIRRHQLGLPVGTHMGNGNMWANSARALGYWVDHQARHVGDIMVFAAGQDGASPVYGHVAIIEKINPDGSVETSECGAALQGKTTSRTFSAQQVAQHQIIHY
jgi:surface antigen